MKLSVLVDNSSCAPSTKPENGLALYLQDGDIKILFDTGHHTLRHNAQQLGCDLCDVSHIVLSHGHYDHSCGLPGLVQQYKEKRGAFPQLICHPNAFDKRSVSLDLWMTSFCIRTLNPPFTKEEIENIFPTTFSKDPLWLSDRFVFLGEIPRDPEVDEEAVFGSLQKEGSFFYDPIIDDSALVYRSSEGLVVIVGCAHSGICNIIEYAKRVCAEERILDIIGGFHLYNADKKRLRRVKSYMNRLDPKSVHACHCTGKARRFLPHQQNIGIGTVLSYPE